jgi:BspA type Leucine rich repeat region (6 copies)/Secretion system C-terminal sorting domain
MKKILLIALFFMATSSLFAQYFTAGGINYFVTSSTIPLTVLVGSHSTFTGAANIPATVSDGGFNYAVTSISNNAFQFCSGLTSVSIPNSVTSIGSNAFQNCSGLTSINIPNSVTIIGGSAFRSCTGLTSVSIPSSVATISTSAFNGCIGLTSVSIPSSVTSIGGSTFSGCTGLTSVSIPSSVTSIGNFAFRSCTGLTSVSISSSVTSIGSNAFASCTGLTSVSVNWQTPLTITADVFTGVTLANVALNVPAGTVAAYDTVADNVWTNFNPISATLSNSAFNATAAINLYPNPSTGVFNFQLANDLQIEVYNNLGQLLSSEKMFSGSNVINIDNQAAGIYFLKANDGTNTSAYKIIKN